MIATVTVSASYTSTRDTTLQHCPLLIRQPQRHLPERRLNTNDAPVFRRWRALALPEGRAQAVGTFVAKRVAVSLAG
ncbi:hypothetical protein [Belnapia rosea]|uniref:Uncharacterized protein n=1 Tax=Belnapia rosea TaxID=938405 RepID=A0A1G6KA69_9PROT|nr:hypothetical protein [Belnapia rosea]SDC27758.1 hypothetical protein SAMN04487779_1001440 [Belnapia rosea]